MLLKSVIKGPVMNEEQEWHLEWNEDSKQWMIRYWFDFVFLNSEPVSGEKTYTLEEFRSENFKLYQLAIEKINLMKV